MVFIFEHCWFFVFIVIIWNYRDGFLSYVWFGEKIVRRWRQFNIKPSVGFIGIIELRKCTTILCREESVWWWCFVFFSGEICDAFFNMNKREVREIVGRVFCYRFIEVIWTFTAHPCWFKKIWVTQVASYTNETLHVCVIRAPLLAL